MHPKTLLILVGHDPRESAKPSEAVRIAAGVGAWGKVIPSIYFQGEAVRCLAGDFDDLRGGALLEEYLPAVLRHGGALYYSAPPAVGLARCPWPAKPWSAAELLRAIHASDRLMNFGAALPAAAQNSLS